MHFAALFFASLVASQTTTSFGPEQLSSASSAALEADYSVILNFVEDFGLKYTSYVNFMAANKMALPTPVGNYFVAIQSFNHESELTEYIKTQSFPFSDIATMITKFDWYSDILSSAGASTFYQPEYFLTGGHVAEETGSASGSSLASQTSSVNLSATVSSASKTISELSSSAKESSASSTASSSSVSDSQSSSASATSSQNNAGVQFVPVLSLPLMLAPFLL